MSDPAIYPWLLKPKLTSAIWGGAELVRRYGKHGDIAEKLGESWECWDTNRVINGALKGLSIATLREKLGENFLGNLDAKSIFPILTKIITAHDWLSVQVHPDDAYAQRIEHQACGKTECWYVLDAQPDAELVVGWLHDTSRDEYVRRVADGTLAEILRKIPVRTGDVVYIPAGRVHAIGPGVTVFETQQASDLTYRMFDWNRLGLDGKARTLQIHKAAEVLDYAAGDQANLVSLPYLLDGLPRTVLIADSRFTVEHISAASECASLATNGSPLIFMSLEHPMQITCGGKSAMLQKYQTAVIPAAADSCQVRSCGDKAPFLLVTPENTHENLVSRLLSAGLNRDQINAFFEQFRCKQNRQRPISQAIVPCVTD
jgi:mannose-6-phosphate isomerase